MTLPRVSSVTFESLQRWVEGVTLVSSASASMPTFSAAGVGILKDAVKQQGVTRIEIIMKDTRQRVKLDTRAAILDWCNRHIYIARHPHVVYTSDSNMLPHFVSDDDDVHYLLSTAGR